MTDSPDWRHQLFPEWVERLERVDLPIADDRRLIVASATLPIAAKQPRMVADAASVAEMVALLSASPVAALAVDSEFRYGGRPVFLKSGREWNDIRSLEPLLVSVAAWLTGEGIDAIVTYVLDVRQPEVVEALGALLRLPVPLVAHYLKAELFTFWRLGLDPDLEQVYDTHIAAAALNLGVFHQRGGGREATPQVIAAERAVTAKKAGLLSLMGQCHRYSIDHPFEYAKEALQRSFINHTAGAHFTAEQVAYAAADADATLRLYVAQQPDLLRSGLHAHLAAIEFPFTVANARIEWNGLPIDWLAARRVRATCARASHKLARELTDHGIVNPNSRDQVLRALQSAGLGPQLAMLARRGRPRLDKDTLKALKQYHPLPGLVLKYREYARLGTEEWLTGVLASKEDLRLRPDHGQLRTDTGRNNCTKPNIAGLNAKLRPLVVAPPGRALIELDYGQIEVGVAAAEHRDAALIASYNAEDVYVALAQRFYADQLGDEERTMDAAPFKDARPEMRKQMKIFALAVLFQMTAPTIAVKYNLTLKEAEEARRRFLDTFPAVREGLAAASAYGLARGYAYIRSGLRRRLSQVEWSRSKARNSMINTPIQGGAAVVFKKAVVALDRHFRGTATRIILPLHDAVLLECDAAEAGRVAAEAAAIMKEAMHATYPALIPKVDINDAAPNCWNKDGKADSIEEYLAMSGGLLARQSIDDLKVGNTGGC